jgi:hypothetical protein
MAGIEQRIFDFGQRRGFHQVAHGTRAQGLKHPLGLLIHRDEHCFGLRHLRPNQRQAFNAGQTTGQADIGQDEPGRSSTGPQRGQQLFDRADHEAALKLGLGPQVGVQHLPNGRLVFDKS